MILDLILNKIKHFTLLALVCAQFISCKVKSASTVLANYYNQEICENIVESDFWVANFRYKYFLDTILKYYPATPNDTIYVLFENQDCSVSNIAHAYSQEKFSILEYRTTDDGIANKVFGLHFEDGNRFVDTFYIETNHFKGVNKVRKNKVFRHFFQDSLEIDSSFHYCDPHYHIGMEYYINSHDKLEYNFYYFWGNRFIELDADGYMKNVESYGVRNGLLFDSVEIKQKFKKIKIQY